MSSSFFRKRPITIQAWQYPGPGFILSETPLWFQENWGGALYTYDMDPNVYIRHNRHGVLTVQPTDWIIFGSALDIYPCTDDVFQQVYVPDEAAPAPVTPVLGYRPQPADKLAQVNANKVLEERTLRAMDSMALVDDIDKRWLSIGRTHIEQGFMAINRAVFKPDRLKLPEDVDAA